MVKKRSKKEEQISEDKAVYVCPKCGNTESFIEEGYAKVKQEVDYVKDKGRGVVGMIGNVDVDDFDADSITCAKCGAKVE